MKLSKPSRKQLVYFGAIASSIAFVIYCVVSSPEQIGWTGFKEDTEVSKTEKILENGKEITVVTKNVSGKTLWDFLQLFGTLALPVLLFVLANRFQDREKEIAEDNQRGQALETYLDRISNILLEHQFFLLDRNKPDEKLKCDMVLAVIRARTLEILRRFGTGKNTIDSERKCRVLLFLYDVELIYNSDETLKTVTSEKVETDKPLLDLSGADFSGANLSGANLGGADLRSADFSSANLSGANFSHANLRGVKLCGAKLCGAKLCGAILSGAKLSGTDLRSANLNNANLRGADLSNVTLSGATLSGAKLVSTDLGGANLCGAVLSRADLCGADFSHANLYGANLCGADFSSAILSHANLYGANLCGANLGGADVRSADLRSADLKGTILSGANLSGATYDDETTLPRNCNPETRGMEKVR